MARELALVVRPFDDAHEILWDALASTLIKTEVRRYAVGEHQLTSDQWKSLSSSSSSVEVDVRLEELATLIQPLGLGLQDLRLSVRAYSKFMNLSDLVFSEKLSEIESMPLTIHFDTGSRPDLTPLFACHTGLQVQAAITLDVQRTLPASSLAPRYRHTILSEARFSFMPTNNDGNGCDILRLNPEVRTAERLSKNVLIYIKRIESPLTSTKLSDVLSVYVDGQLLDRIKARRSSGMAKFHIKQIGVAIHSDIAMRSSIELNRQMLESGAQPKVEDLRHTVTGRLLEKLTKKGQVPGYQDSPEQILDELIERPERSLARIQEVWSCQSHAIDSLELEENQN